MALKVHSFCIKDKLSTNRYHNLLMSTALFYVLISEEGRFRELSLNVSKKFHYKRFVGYGDFPIDKADEYNVLVDFILNNKGLVKEKWHLTEESLEELLEGLKLVLIKDYGTCSGFRKLMLRAPILFKKFVRDLLRRLKRC